LGLSAFRRPDEDCASSHGWCLPEGKIFIDLNHRYNPVITRAGTAARFCGTGLSPGDRKWDVTVTWNIEGHRISTTGHVFTHRGSQPVWAAGLRIEKRFVVDYASDNFTGGVLRQSLYVLRRSDQEA